jgi:hypothetical protein
LATGLTLTVPRARVGVLRCVSERERQPTGKVREPNKVEREREREREREEGEITMAGAGSNSHELSSMTVRSTQRTQSKMWFIKTHD